MLKINENFIIDSDEHQFIVKELGTVKDKKSKNFGKETQVVYGYYATLEGAIRGLEKHLQRRAIKVKDYALKQFVEEIQKIHDDIFKVLGDK